jgi:hypothetical protein
MAVKHDDLSATWTSDDGAYEARVRYSDTTGVLPYDRRALWRWELFWPGGQLASDDAGRISTPTMVETDPLDVLATLASFLGAWTEALDSPYETSENRDLFPRDAFEFIPAIEDFNHWGYDHENPYDEGEVG